MPAGKVGIFEVFGKVADQPHKIDSNKTLEFN